MLDINPSIRESFVDLQCLMRTMGSVQQVIFKDGEGNMKYSNHPPIFNFLKWVWPIS